MLKIEKLLLLFFAFSLLWAKPIIAQEATYYAELAKQEFALKDYQSAYEDALSALDMDPQNHEALSVIASLKGVKILCAEQQRQVAMANMLAVLDRQKKQAPEKKLSVKRPGHRNGAGEFSSNASAFDSTSSKKPIVSDKREKPGPALSHAKKAGEKGNVKITGKIRLAGEVNSDGDIIWKDANPDKNAVPYEKNWRYLWSEEHENTFDPKVYDKLEINIDTDFPDTINLYAQLVLDPWSYVGTIDAHVSSIIGGDEANVRLKYFFATGRTMNEIFRTNYGNILTFNDIKVVDGKLSPYIPTGIADWYTYFYGIGGEDVHERWNIIRKLWFDYEKEGFSGKLFLLSSQQEALKSDDIMRLSDNRKDWEESAWLDTYSPSRVFDRHGNPLKGGKWERNISAYVRDSEWERLTYLRGASFSIDNGPVKFDATVALPMTLWDDYSDVNSLDGAFRGKYFLNGSDNEYLGAFFSSKLGFNDSDDLEAENYVWAIDGAKQFLGSMVTGEVAYSTTTIDEANNTKTDYDDYAYAIKIEPMDWQLNKIEFYYNYMGDKFSPGLSSYRYTRIETEASKHISFDKKENKKKGIDYYGDGIDRGRSSVGFYTNFDAFDINWDFFVRNVHDDTGNPLETMSRLEATTAASDKLTLKALAWYKALPKTEEDKDPLIYADNLYDISDYYSGRNELLQNTAIEKGKDPSIGHFALAGHYKFDDSAYFELGFEETNDPMVFPRVLLCNTYVTSEFADNVYWDKIVPFLYNQEIFGLPPYDYYHIIKMKLGFKPVSDLELTLSYTKNQNKYSMAGIDDNGNHFGVEALYAINPKAELFFSYTYAQLYDVYKYSTEGNLDYEGHNNFFVGYKYMFGKDEFLKAMWGEYAGYDSDADYWYMSALDTRHIFRLVYEKKF